MKASGVVVIACSALVLNGCMRVGVIAEKKEDAPPVYFQVDPATAGTVSGVVHFAGKRPAKRQIDLSEDPACVEAHGGKAFDESTLVNVNGTLANTFVYVKSGLGNRKFAPPASPVTIDQRGCWFQPRVLGIETGQLLSVINSDPVTHNIHPLAEVNREWNHSQGAGDAPLRRKFSKQEIMIRVKCNIHSWMRAYIGVLDHPYFAVTGSSGSFEIRNLPPGDYIISAWHENLESQERKITISPSGTAQTEFTFVGE